MACSTVRKTVAVLQSAFSYVGEEIRPTASEKPDCRSEQPRSPADEVIEKSGSLHVSYGPIIIDTHCPYDIRYSPIATAEAPVSPATQVDEAGFTRGSFKRGYLKMPFAGIWRAP